MRSQITNLVLFVRLKLVSRLPLSPRRMDVFSAGENVFCTGWS